MIRALLVALLLMSSLSFLGAADFNWGIKYGIGLSSIHGANSDYETSFDIQEHAASVSDYGNIQVHSSDKDYGLSQNAGLYASTRLFHKTSSIRMGTEVVWHRYVFNQHFDDSVPNTSNPILAAAFGDTLGGRIETTVDYITVPLLISFNQVLPEEQEQQQYQGAFIYAGPSFSYLIYQSLQSYGGFNSLEESMDDLTNVISNPDPSVSYSYTRKENGCDKLKDFKTDLVFGTGFALKDLFGFGLGTDEFVFDLRFTIGLDNLGDSGWRNAFNLRSILLSAGCRL